MSDHDEIPPLEFAVPAELRLANQERMPLEYVQSSKIEVSQIECQKALGRDELRQSIRYNMLLDHTTSTVRLSS